jgi:hypothetical protein
MYGKGRGEGREIKKEEREKRFKGNITNMG